jgi:hypothetical protein
MLRILCMPATGRAIRISSMFMLPAATTSPHHLEQTLSQLESFLGLSKRKRTPTTKFVEAASPQ